MKYNEVLYFIIISLLLSFSLCFSSCISVKKCENCIIESVLYSEPKRDNCYSMQVRFNHCLSIEIRKELINQADFIISQHEFMKELSKENQAQWQLIDKHEKDIQEIRILVRSLSDEIKNIYKELNKLNDRVDNLEKRWEEFKNEDIMLEAEEAEEEIKNRFEELTEQVNKFSDIKKSDFAKSIIIANNNGQFNIENMENVADNIQNYK